MKEPVDIMKFLKFISTESHFFSEQKKTRTKYSKEEELV